MTPLTDTTIKSAGLGQLAETEIEIARDEYLAAFGIYQRFPNEENRLAQQRAYQKLERLYKDRDEANHLLYERVCAKQVRS